MLSRLLGAAALSLLAACGNGAVASVDEVRFAAFTLHEPDAASICRWVPTASDAVVIWIPGTQVEGGDRCDYPVHIQLLGELPPDVRLVGPVNTNEIIADAAPQRLDLSSASSLERYALAWLGSDEADPNVRVAAPLAAGAPTGWYHCPHSCAAVFAYRGVAVRVMWNPEVHGDDAGEMTRRAHEFLDAHATPAIRD